jgi:2-polyprenyl-6-methoxyphenol hydroxylase-like FAD-dependent oxidoreductase
VIGSGVAGLAAAAVLARRFDQVVVLERDTEPAACDPRKGVPQGNHVHILLKGGQNALEEIFPGLTAELREERACEVNFGEELHWFHYGAWQARYDSPHLVLQLQSRPFLESVLRRRLSALGKVEIRHGVSAVGIDIEAGRARAVRVRDADGNATIGGVAGVAGNGEPVPADLIVDASGRGSRLSDWLQRYGYPTPREERIGVNLQYASRFYRAWPDPRRDWKALLVYPVRPAGRRIGALFSGQQDLWMATAGGYAGDHPPADEAGFLEFLGSLPRPDIHSAIRDAEPLSDIHTFRFPHARWLRYEELSRFPAGLVPLGDSVCSFDPVFGQGMSVAALGARALDVHLEADPRAENVRRFLRAVSKIVAVPWLLASSEDLRYPEVDGRRPFWLAGLQSYTRRVFQASGTNAAVYDRLLRVLHLLAGPELLFHPAVLAGVLGMAADSVPGRLRRRASSARRYYEESL